MSEIDYMIIVLFSMLFLHIVDDYYLQGILAKMKQCVWWSQNYPQAKYQDDFVTALFTHAFSWSFMIHIPVALYFIAANRSIVPLVFTLMVNTFIHAFVDHLKANYYAINLTQDQLLHLGQILLTWSFTICK